MTLILQHVPSDEFRSWLYDYIHDRNCAHADRSVYGKISTRPFPQASATAFVVRDALPFWMKKLRLENSSHRVLFSAQVRFWGQTIQFPSGCPKTGPLKVYTALYSSIAVAGYVWAMERQRAREKTQKYLRNKRALEDGDRRLTCWRCADQLINTSSRQQQMQQ